MGETLVAGISDGAIYGLIALGIVLVYKGTRVLNFAQGEIGTLSLFLAWWLIEERNVPWAVAALAAVTFAGALGGVFERFVVRRMGEATRLSVTVATIGLLLLLLGIEFQIWGTNPQIFPAPLPGRGPQIFGFFVSPTRQLAMIALLAIGVGLGIFLRKTDFGLGVLAASQDPAATRLVGVPLARVSSFTWVVAGAISAIAALLVAPTIGVFHAGMMTELFVRGLAAALLGGLVSMPGAFVGGIGIGIIEAFVGDMFVQSTLPGLPVVAVMLVIVGVLLLRPQGILGKALR